MLALPTVSEVADFILGWLYLLVGFSMPIALPVIAVSLPVLIGIGIFARRRNRPKLERFAMVGSLICLAIVLGLMLALSN